MLSEADRNMASLTESAVWKREQREHSGAGWLNSSREFARYRQVGQHVVRVKHKSGRAIPCRMRGIAGRQMVFQCGWYRG